MLESGLGGVNFNFCLHLFLRHISFLYVAWLPIILYCGLGTGLLVLICKFGQATLVIQMILSSTFRVTLVSSVDLTRCEWTQLGSELGWFPEDPSWSCWLPVKGNEFMIKVGWFFLLLKKRDSSVGLVILSKDLHYIIGQFFLTDLKCPLGKVKYEQLCTIKDALHCKFNSLYSVCNAPSWGTEDLKWKSRQIK